MLEVVSSRGEGWRPRSAKARFVDTNVEVGSCPELFQEQMVTRTSRLKGKAITNADLRPEERTQCGNENLFPPHGW